MKSADSVVIATLVLLVGAIAAYLIKNRKKSGCAGCPYAKNCSARNPDGCPHPTQNKVGKKDP